MALPSQTERTAEMSRPIMTRTGGRPAGGPPNKLALGVVTLVVAAGAVYGIMRLLPGGSTSPANAQAADKPIVVAPQKPAVPAPRSITPTSAPATAPAAPLSPQDNPIVLSQGKTGAAGTSPTPEPAGPLTTALNNQPAGSGSKPAPVDVMNPGATAPAPTLGAPGAAAPLPAINSASSVRTLIEAGDRAFAANKLVEARVSYSKALLSPDIARSDAEVLRAKLTTANDDLLFSTKVTPGDPLVESYSVASGDSLERIKKKRDLAIDWRLLARVNKITNPSSLKVGQKVKLIRGPFSVIVHKNDFRLDLFAGSPDEQESWLYIRSFRVGLGEGGNTPVGTFVIKTKMVHPDWTNPKTGQHFAAKDPENPIGDYWLGWEGLGESKVYTGFGLHGTIDPASIGQNKSMGCVRMLADDIAEMYELLVEQVSLVKIVEGDALPGQVPTAPTAANPTAPVSKPGPIDLTK
jgi:hypothetical protein